MIEVPGKKKWGRLYFICEFFVSNAVQIVIKKGLKIEDCDNLHFLEQSQVSLACHFRVRFTSFTVSVQSLDAVF